MIMEKYWPDKKCVVMTRDEVRAFDAWAMNSQYASPATLFDPTGAGNNIDLNTLIDPATGWTLECA